MTASGQNTYTRDPGAIRLELERDTPKHRLDKRLEALGWSLQPFRSGLNPQTLIATAVMEFETTNGPADYAPIADGELIGIRYIDATTTAILRHLLDFLNAFCISLRTRGVDSRHFVPVKTIPRFGIVDLLVLLILVTALLLTLVLERIRCGEIVA